MLLKIRLLSCLYNFSGNAGNRRVVEISDILRLTPRTLYLEYFTVDDTRSIASITCRAPGIAQRFGRL